MTINNKRRDNQYLAFSHFMMIIAYIIIKLDNNISYMTTMLLSLLTLFPL